VLAAAAMSVPVAGCTSHHSQLVSKPAATPSQLAPSAVQVPSRAPTQAAASSAGELRASVDAALASSVAPSNAEVHAAVTATTMSVHLPMALSRVVAVARNGLVVVLGGLDAHNVTTSQTLIFDPTASSIRFGGHLAVGVHDAGAGIANGTAYVFGGGSAASTNAVQAVHTDGTAAIVGRLPGPRSDDSVAVAGDVLYVLGGYDGVHELPSVLATTDGVTFHQVGQLRETVRYGAAYASPGAVWMIGGEHQGTPIADIQRVDTRTGVSTLVGALPHPLAHAVVAVVGGQVLILGGSDGHYPQKTIYAFDPVTGSVTLAGSLPESVSDMATAVVAGTAYVLGGDALTGTRSIAPTAAIVAVSIS
jgi:N-acetylneuraminic acid mutarotase